MTDKEKIEKLSTKAVAVKQSDRGVLPKITAKGEGYLAERILDIAFAEGVKVRQDKDLTELLNAFEVDSPVPLEALHAVSLILERVYAENQKLSGQSDEHLDPVNTDRQPDDRQEDAMVIDHPPTNKGGS